MFKFGYEFSVIRRNNVIPFVNGGIYASIRSEQPQWRDGHEAVYTLRLYNFIIVYQGASSKPLDKSSANHRKSIPKQDYSYRNIVMIIAIFENPLFMTKHEFFYYVFRLPVKVKANNDCQRKPLLIFGYKTFKGLRQTFHRLILM
jgi:hypothetical protein